MTRETTKITINELINVVITIPPSIYTLQKINKCANQHYANNDKPGYLIPPFFLFQYKYSHRKRNKFISNAKSKKAEMFCSSIKKPALAG